MGNSIINSAKNLLERTDTKELSSRISEKIGDFATTLNSMGVTTEYTNGVFERISHADNEEELDEAIGREYAKIEMLTLREEDEEDALGKGTEDAEGKGAKYAKPVKTKGNAKRTLDDKKKGRTNEHLDALFSGEDLSNSFKQRAADIFEAAVNARVEEIQSELVKQSRDVFIEEVVAVKETLSTQVDDYLDYVVSEWMSENELAVENGIQTEISESFMNGLRDLFERHYINVPNSKLDILEDMAQKNNQLKNQINGIIKENIKLTKKATSANCSSIFESACHGLADTEVEKLKSLARGIEYSNEAEFGRKINTLKESYFNRKSKPLTTLVEESNSSEYEQELEPRMNAYFNSVGRLADATENNTQS
jgi:hypothetical protein